MVRVVVSRAALAAMEAGQVVFKKSLPVSFVPESAPNQFQHCLPLSIEHSAALLALRYFH
jgi:hypothetical protein